jgi:hypothetical protein
MLATGDFTIFNIHLPLSGETAGGLERKGEAKLEFL